MRTLLLGLFVCAGLRADLLTVTASAANGFIKSDGGLGFKIASFNQALGTLNAVSVDWSATISEFDIYWFYLAPLPDPTVITGKLFGSFAGVSDTVATVPSGAFSLNCGFGAYACGNASLGGSVAANGQAGDISPFLGDGSDFQTGATLGGRLVAPDTDHLGVNGSGVAYLNSINVAVTYDYTPPGTPVPTSVPEPGNVAVLVCGVALTLMVAAKVRRRSRSTRR